MQAGEIVIGIWEFRLILLPFIEMGITILRKEFILDMLICYEININRLNSLFKTDLILKKKYLAYKNYI